MSTTSARLSHEESTAQASSMSERCRAAEDAFDRLCPDARPPTTAIVIVGSSRGGTSFLFDLLCSTGAFRAMPGEHTPLYRTYGALPMLNPSDDGDALDTALADIAAFKRALRNHSAAAEANTNNWDAQRIVVLLERQWGWLGHPSSLWEAVGRQISRLSPTTSIETDVVDILRSVPGVDVRYYDLGRSANHLEARPSGPPAPCVPVIESPPFVMPLPVAAVPSLRGTHDKPLLMKASVDAYRLPWLTKVFDRVKVVHLTRNPAASVNGLIDGWLSHGYFSYLLPQSDGLHIGGYSGTGWANVWWNFDLPPDWRALKQLPLAEVCAAQWLAAHTSILSGLRETGVMALRVRAEELMMMTTDIRATVARVMSYCGVEEYGPVRPRVVMSTAPPGPYRWYQCREVVENAVTIAPMLDMAEQLGYKRTVDSGWS